MSLTHATMSIGCKQPNARVAEVAGSNYNDKKKNKVN